jgi:DNA modification methylase
MEYREFLETKKITAVATGFDLQPGQVHRILFDWQRDIVVWACRTGKAAIFADCGLGKTFMQLEWARLVHEHTGKPILIVAPLAVSLQTRREGEKLGIEVRIARKQSDVKENGIYITNYERLEHFDASVFGAVVLDESGILKNYTGKIKTRIAEMFLSTPFKLCCTATPSPNDHMELLNHASFLDVMNSHEALAIWFINDTMNMGTYRLKHHAVKDFWKWVSTWAISCSKPSDLGYADNGFILPDLQVLKHMVTVDISQNTDGALFRMPDLNATGYHKEKRQTAPDRARVCAEIVNSTDEIYCVWCETNCEADELRKQLPEAIEVRGDDSVERKEQVSRDFADGKIRVLISKPSIFGFGMNFQVCHNVIFCGLSYSYESYYQATRRFWRFGQKHPVNVYIVIGDTEKSILDVILRKENDFQELKTNMQWASSCTEALHKGTEYKMEYEKKIIKGQNFELICGDSTEEIKHMPDNSHHLQIFSPPFSSLYIYSDSYRDMGNSKDDDEFFEHFEYLIPELYRTLIPGRICAVHCKDLVNYKNRDGAAGLRDFPGRIIAAFEKAGFIYHSRVTIWKDPVIEMQRTKSHGLLYCQLRKDSTHSRQGLPDYLLGFRKWPEDYIDPEPVNWKTKDNFELEKWQRYASPVWGDIQQTDVLNTALAREKGDEKHICPLQLGVIERAVELWTNPGDVVFTPFAGIGSELVVSLRMKRRAQGVELKEQYWKQAARNCQAVDGFEQTSLF